MHVKKRHVIQRNDDAARDKRGKRLLYTPACDPVQTVTLHERRAKCVLCIDPESTHEDSSERHHVLSLSFVGEALSLVVAFVRTPTVT